MKIAVTLSSCLVAWAVTTAAWAGVTIPFEGMIDLKAERLTLELGYEGDKTVAFDLRRDSPESMQFTVDLRHLKVPFFDLVTELKGDIHLTGDGPESREAYGEVRSQYTLVNHRPVRDLYLKYSLRERKLVIHRFWAGAMSGAGQVELFGNYNSSIALDLVSLDMGDFVGVLRSGLSVEPPSVSGILAGNLSLTGPFLTPAIKGRMAVYNGCFNALCYESILLQMGGTYPKVLLDGSEVHTEGFSFNILGSVDVSDPGKIPLQVPRLKRVAIVAANEDRREWVLKQRTGSDKDSVAEVKYFMLKDDRGDAEGVLGFERKIGF